MFGFSFGELVVLVIVSIIVIGPKDLPKVLRKLGQWAAKLRRMATDLRTQSGIDDILHAEGIADDIAEIRKLARGELGTVSRSARIDPTPNDNEIVVDTEREYPEEGADSYGAMPDTTGDYAEILPPSALAENRLYTHGN